MRFIVLILGKVIVSPTKYSLYVPIIVSQM